MRHAETEWSRNGRHTGRTDIPLTERGREGARALAERLRGRAFERVLVSPAVRARETCELCGLGAQAQVREDLLEWDYGDYEGLTTPEIRVQRPGWLLWRDGCPGGESAADVGARADRVIAQLGAAAAAAATDAGAGDGDGNGNGDGDGDAAIFSHGHMLRVLGARWIALGPESGGRLGLSTAAICVLGHERETPVIARWNDTGTDPSPALTRRQ